MAGGAGTRLWPKSRKDFPKQLHALTSKKTLLFETVKRCEKIIDKNNIYIVTNQAYLTKIQSEIPEIPHKNYVVEFYPWGTILGAMVAAKKIVKKEANATIMLCWCDHYIKRKSKFLSLIRIGEKCVKKFNLLTILGIKPGFAATGYGYLKIGDELGKIGKERVYKLEKFFEKPNQKTAEKYISQYNYLWNSGIFMFSVGKIGELFKKFLPKHAKRLEDAEQWIGETGESKKLNLAFRGLDPVSIDKGISEKTKDIAVIPADIGWSDIGDWQTLKKVLKTDKDGNVILGDHLGIDLKNSIIYGGKRLITTIGLDNMIIIDTDDTILVAGGENSQDLKKLLELAEKKGKTQYL